MRRRRTPGLVPGVLLLAACGGGSPLLPTDADQGLEGRVLLGPRCPVQSPEAPCPDAPYVARIDLRDGGGGRVTTIRSDSAGRFRVGLVPGRYRLEPRGADPFPHASPLEVTIRALEWLELTIRYDTGIR